MKISNYINHRESVIYILLNTENMKKYIGVTTNFNRRKYDHLYKLRNNTHVNKSLQNDYNKFGESAFEFTIIKNVNNRTEAMRIEDELIKEHDSIDNGYNIKGKEAVWKNKISLSAQIHESAGSAIVEHIDKNNITKSEWVREAILEKAKRDGIV